MENSSEMKIDKEEWCEPKNILEYPTCGHETGAFQCKSLKMEDIQHFHSAYYSSGIKANQDAFLVKHTRTCPVSRRRPKNFKNGEKEFQIKCFVFTTDNKSVPVCQKTFLNILGIKKTRLRYSIKRYHVYEDYGFVEMRGGDRKSAKNASHVTSIIAFLKSLKCFEPHYCCSRTSVRRYLPSELNVNKLFKMFCEEQQLDEVSAKGWLFRRIFNTRFSLSFKTPQTDACSTCCEFDEKSKLASTGEEKTLIEVKKHVHKLTAGQFYEFLKEEREDLLMLSFDCQKNQSLPKLQDQSIYYSRQLYMYSLTIVEGSSNCLLTPSNVFTYCCTEDQFYKDANLVASAVYHRLLNTVFNDKIKRIRLMTDGCGGQNKNLVLICMASKWLADSAPTHIEEIELIFPVMGHCFLPSDQGFGTLEKRITAENVIVQPEQYVEMYKQNATVFKFGDDCSVYNWKQEAIDKLKPLGSWHFKFAKSKRFFIRRSSDKTNFLVRGEWLYNSDSGFYKEVTKESKTVKSISPGNITPGNVHFKFKIIRNVQNLILKHYGENWRDLEHLSYYSSFLNTVSVNYDADNNEKIEEQNQLCVPLEEELEEDQPGDIV